MTIGQILDLIYLLPNQSKQKLEQKMEMVCYPKGHLLLKADQIEDSVYFIKKGILRAYTCRNGEEVTFWFGKEGDTALSMKSYVQRLQGYENIELLEDCELYHIKANELQYLFDRDIHIANWGRKFAELEIIKTEERLISRLFKSASERYRELMENNPELIRRVQLTYIASFLGITPVSLSRIRAEFR